MKKRMIDRNFLNKCNEEHKIVSEINLSKLFYKFVIVIVNYLQVCNCKMIQI